MKLEKKENKVFYADILLQYKHLIPEVVCENCQKKDELVRVEENDTGWWCRRCDGMEVNYQRDDFIEDVLGCDKEVAQEIQTAVLKERTRILGEISSKVEDYEYYGHVDGNIAKEQTVKIIKAIITTKDTKDI